MTLEIYDNALKLRGIREYAVLLRRLTLRYYVRTLCEMGW